VVAGRQWLTRTCMTPKGFIARESKFDCKESMDRLCESAVGNGMAIVARIDHAAAAAQFGLELRPAEVLIFGNPQAGTPLMQKAPTAAIDLPLKALVWQGAAGKIWIGYNDPLWIAQRHGVDALTWPSLRSMEVKLATVVNAAASD
jgi:uncharacterized protein (DUF302 family)